VTPHVLGSEINYYFQLKLVATDTPCMIVVRIKR